MKKTSGQKPKAMGAGQPIAHGQSPLARQNFAQFLDPRFSEFTLKTIITGITWM